MNYHYTIIELTPNNDNLFRDCYRFVESYDRLEDAEKVMAVMDKTSIDFSVYRILLQPIVNIHK